MNTIHSQTGVIEEPLTTLGEQLSEPAKDILHKTAEAAFAQAPIKRRAGWWLEAHTGRVLIGALVVGAITGYAVFRKIR